ncbi:putative helicase [Achromobacter phage AMA2]|nr:putative helicase [Achromobacter phage AMA2]
MGPYEPVFEHYKHQAREFEFRNEPSRALLWQMRTGKTKAMIDMAFALFVDDKIDQVLVLAPNGVHLNWQIKQLPMHAWKSMPFEVCSWVSSESRKPLYLRKLNDLVLNPKGTARNSLRWYCMNSESCWRDRPKKSISMFLGQAKKGTLLIVDESDDFRKISSKRTKLAVQLRDHVQYRRILTGSFTDNAPLAAYSQLEILKKHALGFTKYSDFEAHFATYKNAAVYDRQGNARRVRVIDEYRNQTELKQLVAQYASVVLREECDDMPTLVRADEFFELEPEQRKLYTSICDKLLEEEGLYGDIFLTDVFSGGVKSIKLQQVSNGFFVDAEGEVTDLPNPRAEVYRRIIQEQLLDGRKVITWCRYHEDIKRVKKVLDELGIKYVEFHGGISTPQRMKNMHRFMTDDECTVFIGQPAAGGRGLDLSVAKTVIWYSHTYDLIHRRQADERATHIGGHTIDVIDLQAVDTVDMSIMNSLSEKTSLSDYVSRHGLQAFLTGKTLV